MLVGDGLEVVLERHRAMMRSRAQPAVISTVLPSGIVDEAHVGIEVRAERRTTAVIPGIDHLRIQRVDGGVPVHEELEERARAAAWWDAVGVVPHEGRGEDQVVAATQVDGHVPPRLDVRREHHAKASIERHGAMQVLDQEDDHREARAGHLRNLP